MTSGRSRSITPPHRSRVAQIGLIKARPRVDLVALAGGEIVDDGDFMTAARRQRVHRMRADKAGAAGDQNSHPNSSPCG